MSLGERPLDKYEKKFFEDTQTDNFEYKCDRLYDYEDHHDDDEVRDLIRDIRNILKVKDAKKVVIVYLDYDGELNWYTEAEIRADFDNLMESIAENESDGLIWKNKSVMEVLEKEWMALGI